MSFSVKKCAYKQFYDSDEINISPLIGFSDVEILDEELDRASLTFINDSSEELPVMGYLQYTVFDSEIKENILLEDGVMINKYDYLSTNNTISLNGDFLYSLENLCRESYLDIAKFGDYRITIYNDYSNSEVHMYIYVTTLIGTTRTIIDTLANDITSNDDYELGGTIIKLTKNCGEIVAISLDDDYAFANNVLRALYIKRPYSIDRTYLIGSDEVSPIQKMSGAKKYEHFVTLVEVTKKLEKTINEVICFTQPTTKGSEYEYTIYDCIKRLLKIATLRTTFEITDTSSIFRVGDITYTFANGLHTKDKKGALDVVAPQMVLSEGTLKDKINDVLKFVKGIVRMNDYKTISVDFFNAITGNKDVSGKILDFSKDINVEEYATNLVTYANNTINESNPDVSSITEPSPDAFKMVSTDEYVLTDSNFSIITDNPIYTVQSIGININISSKVKVTYFDGTSRTPITALENTYSSYVVPITNRIIEEEQYNNLDEELLDGSRIYRFATMNDLKNYYTKANTLSYKYNGNKIDLALSKKSLLLDYSVFMNTLLISGAINVYNKYNNLTNDKASDFIFSILEGTSYMSATIGYNPTEENTPYTLTVQGYLSSSIDPTKIFYRISYVPISSNFVFEAVKNTPDNAKVETHIMQNQGSKITSLEYYINNLYGKAQRLANEGIQLAVTHTSMRDMLSLGNMVTDTNEFSGDFKVTKLERIYFNNHIECKYILDKNYNRINEYIGIDAEWRGWESPNNNNTYTRNTRYNQYCEVGFDLPSRPLQHTFVNNMLLPISFLGSSKVSTTDDTLNKSMNVATLVFDNSIDTQLTNYLKSLGYGEDYQNVEKALQVPAISNGGGNVLSFNFKFNDNMSCGSYLKELSGKKLMTKIPYCCPNGDNIGRLDRMVIYFSYGSALTDSSVTDSDFYINLPMIRYADVLNSKNPAINTSWLCILKDSSEILSFTYNLFFTPLDNKIKLYKAFTQENPMVKDCEYNTMYIIYRDTPFLDFEEKVDISKYTTTPTNILFTVLTYSEASIEYGVKMQINNTLPESATAYAICDSKGNLYFACNDSSKKEIYFHYVDRRSNVKKDY